MPYYGTQFNFAAEQVFNDLYQAASDNASYPSYWFMTLGTGSTYGLQSTDTNFTVTTLFSSQTLTYNQYSSGTVNIYCGDLGQPVTITGSSSTSYNAVTKVSSVTSLSGIPVSLSWNPAPTPTPSPSASIALTINQPTAITYTTNSILVSLSASGGTVDKIWFNVKNGSSWVYVNPITYTAPYFMSGFANGSYTLYAYANNTAGNTDNKNVAFTVAVPSITPQPGLPTVTIGRPQNITYVVSTVYVALTSTNADAVWFNIKNGSSWVYAYNQTYTVPVQKTGFVNGTYTIYAFAANHAGGYAQDTKVFTIGASASATILPQVDVSNFWLFLYEGNFLGFLQAYFAAVFMNIQTAIALIVMLFMVPIYLRTKSLLLLCILWIMLGGFFIAAMPLASGIAVIFMVLGIGGLIFRLFRNSSN